MYNQYLVNDSLLSMTAAHHRLQERISIQVLLFNTYNSSKHQSFLYKQLNDQTVLF